VSQKDLPILVLGIILCFPEARASAAFEEVGRLVIGFGAGKGNIVVRGDCAYVAPGGGDFAILDIRDKANPQLADIIPSTFFPRTIAPYRGFLYFHNRDGQTQVVDTGRREIKQIPLHRDREGTIRLVDEKLGVLVAANRDYISFLGLENPLAPQRISQIATPGSPADKGALKAIEQEFTFTGNGHAVADYLGPAWWTGLGTEVVTDELIRQGHLTRYRALIVPYAWRVHPETMVQLEQFVERGGILIVGAGSLVKDHTTHEAIALPDWLGMQ